MRVTECGEDAWKATVGDRHGLGLWLPVSGRLLRAVVWEHGKDCLGSQSDRDIQATHSTHHCKGWWQEHDADR